MEATPQDFPLVAQTPVSIVMVSYTDMEALALRSVLECFNYRVEMHHVGSRPQFLEILRGNIPTHPYVILSCHGDEHALVVPYQSPVAAAEVGQVAQLPGRTVVSLGCGTGTEPLATAFLKSGCEAYVAPTGGVEANAAMLFAIHLFYFLAAKQSLSEAVEASRQHDAECALFQLWLSD